MQTTPGEVGYPHLEIGGCTIEKLTVSGDVVRHGHFEHRAENGARSRVTSSPAWKGRSVSRVDIAACRRAESQVGPPDWQASMSAATSVGWLVTKYESSRILRLDLAIGKEHVVPLDRRTGKVAERDRLSAV